MPTPFDEDLPMIEPRRMRWTRAECAVLKEAGIWEKHQLELIDGELYTKKEPPSSASEPASTTEPES